MILESNSYYYSDNKSDKKPVPMNLNSSPSPPKKSKKISRRPNFWSNMEDDHFGPMDLGDSMHSESVLSKGLYGSSPRNFERTIPSYFGGSASSKRLNHASRQFERHIPAQFGGSMHNKSVLSKGLIRGSPHVADNFGPMDRDGSMNSESVLSQGLYSGMH
jgi:hypothetical protein